MALIYAEYMSKPTSTSRSVKNYLDWQGHKVNRKRVQRLMRLMVLEAIYLKPNTSKTHHEHRIDSYLLLKMDINRLDMV